MLHRDTAVSIVRIIDLLTASHTVIAQLLSYALPTLLSRLTHTLGTRSTVCDGTDVVSRRMRGQQRASPVPHLHAQAHVS
jgi:hypothetical protein